MLFMFNGLLHKKAIAALEMNYIFIFIEKKIFLSH